jgi:hypothetical protein
MIEQEEKTLRVEGLKSFKGFVVSVGFQKGSGRFNYVKGDLEQAKRVGESMKAEGEIFWSEERTLYVDIQELDLKKCKNSYCERLCESSEQYCLKCEDLIYEAQIDYAEQRNEEMSYE